MMVVHKLGGKQKAMLISSSIRNTGGKKKKSMSPKQKRSKLVGKESWFSDRYKTLKLLLLFILNCM